MHRHEYEVFEIGSLRIGYEIKLTSSLVLHSSSILNEKQN
jgi:hypothetical protein